MLDKPERYIKQLIDIKADDAINSRALAHISSLQHGVYRDILKWQDTSIEKGFLDQDQIDAVISGLEREEEMLHYMYNALLYYKNVEE